MVMFEERPYRQKTQSFWSIWWFVGLMACGLTAWHLELIPFTNQYSVELSSDNPALAENQESAPTRIANSTIPFSTISGNQAEPTRQDFDLGQAQPIDANQTSNFAAQSSVSNISYSQGSASSAQQTEAMKSFGIQNASYEQTIPQTNAQLNQLPANSAQPFFDSKEEFTPVQTLTYRPDTNPVIPQKIPAARNSIPIQHATASRVKNSNLTQGTMITTAGYSKPVQSQAAEPESHAVQPEPFRLSTDAKRDILRHRELSEKYWKQPEQRAEIASELEK